MYHSVYDCFELSLSFPLTAVPQSMSTTAVPQSMSTTAVPQSTSPTAVPQSMSTTAVPQSTSTTAVPQSMSTTAVPQSTSTNAVLQYASINEPIAASINNNTLYKAVLSDLETLITTFRVTPEAEVSLLLKLQERLWLPIGAEASAKELVTLALNRIEDDVRDYEVFINILRNIAGMEQVVNIITGIYILDLRYNTYVLCLFVHTQMLSMLLV